MKKEKNIFGLILVFLFIIFSIGTTYFFGYHQGQIDDPWSNFFLYSWLVTFIIAIIYGRHNIKSQLKEAYSPSNSRKTIKIFIYLIIGSSIINVISRIIGGSLGYTIGLILSAFLVGGLFLFLKKKHEVNKK